MKMEMKVEKRTAPWWGTVMVSIEVEMIKPRQGQSSKERESNWMECVLTALMETIPTITLSG